MLRYIIFAPLLGAVINWFLGRRLRSERFIGAIACTAVGISTVTAFFMAFKSGGALHLGEPGVNSPILDQLWTWIQVGGFRADFGLAMDRLSGIYVLFITFVGLLIHIFAVGYMRGDTGFYRFFAYLNLFMFMMLTLVLADNFLLMFVGWEGVGLCSYLLIGYYIDREEAGAAAKKAFVVNRIGDWGVVLGIMLVFYVTGSVSFFAKPGVTSALGTIATMATEPFAIHSFFAGGVTSIAILLFIGATGKSAQIPLFVWLPDAMAGPTPVSALIHAATMVTAGVYMIARCSAIYVHAPAAMFVISIIGAATAIFAASIAIAQNDIKKVLAYSTVSQLGYMMLACGVGAFVAAIFHVMTHAFFKALLFLGAGSVIDGMHHEQDMRRMGGLRKYMPITFATMIAGWLAISGIPVFSGFFSKDEILWKTWSSSIGGFPVSTGKILWAIGAITALLTAVYMTRLMLMTFWGQERFSESLDGHDQPPGETSDNVSAHEAAFLQRDGQSHIESTRNTSGESGSRRISFPHESPGLMTIPLIVLAILSTVGGLVGIPYALSGGSIQNYFETTLEPTIQPATNVTNNGSDGTISAPAAKANSREVEGLPAGFASEHVPARHEVAEERIFTIISVAIALAGIGLGLFTFLKRPLLQMPSLLRNKYYVDEIYNDAIVDPINTGARKALWETFDVGVIDGIVNGIGRSITQLGSLARHLQVGFVRSYAAVILLGALFVIGYFAYVFAT